MRTLIDAVLLVGGVLLLQVAVDLVFGLLFIVLGQVVKDVYRHLSDKPLFQNPWSAMLVYAMAGGVGGFLTLLAFPKLFLVQGWPRIINLVIVPCLVAAVVGLLLQRKDEVVHTGAFLNVYVFALAMGLMRLVLGQ